MSTKKPRITVTLEPEAYRALSGLSKAGGGTMSAILSQVASAVAPSMERASTIMQRAALAKPSILDGLRKAADKAQAQLAPAIRGAVEAQETGFQLMEEAKGLPRLRGRVRHEPVPGGGAGGVLTPVPVTRGSGCYKSPEGRAKKGRKHEPL